MADQYYDRYGNVIDVPYGEKPPPGYAPAGQDPATWQYTPSVHPPQFDWTTLFFNPTEGDVTGSPTEPGSRPYDPKAGLGNLPAGVTLPDLLRKRGLYPPTPGAATPGAATSSTSVTPGADVGTAQREPISGGWDIPRLLQPTLPGDIYSRPASEQFYRYSGASGPSSEQTYQPGQPPYYSNSATRPLIGDWRNYSIPQLMGMFSATELSRLPIEALNLFPNQALEKIGNSVPEGIGKFLSQFTGARLLGLGEFKGSGFSLDTLKQLSPARQAELPSWAQESIKTGAPYPQGYEAAYGAGGSRALSTTGGQFLGGEQGGVATGGLYTNEPGGTGGLSPTGGHVLDVGGPFTNPGGTGPQFHPPVANEWNVAPEESKAHLQAQTDLINQQREQLRAQIEQIQKNYDLAVKAQDLEAQNNAAQLVFKYTELEKQLAQRAAELTQSGAIAERRAGVEEAQARGYFPSGQPTLGRETAVSESERRNMEALASRAYQAAQVALGQGNLEEAQRQGAFARQLQTSQFQQSVMQSPGGYLGAIYGARGEWAPQVPGLYEGQSPQSGYYPTGQLKPEMRTFYRSGPNQGMNGPLSPTMQPLSYGELANSPYLPAGVRSVVTGGQLPAYQSQIPLAGAQTLGKLLPGEQASLDAALSASGSNPQDWREQAQRVTRTSPSNMGPYGAYQPQVYQSPTRRYY